MPENGFSPNFPKKVSLIFKLVYPNQKITNKLVLKFLNYDILII